MFEILKGTEHVLLVPLMEAGTAHTLADLSVWASQLPAHLQARLRVVAITRESAADQPNIALYHDLAGACANAYGAAGASFLVRPDGYIGWRGASWRDDGLAAFLSRVFLTPGAASRLPPGARGSMTAS
jgi:hypothetical protein